MSNAAVNKHILDTYRAKVYGNLNGKPVNSEAGRIATRMGAGLRGIDPDEVIKRSDYKSEGEYLMALADYETKMQTPEFRRAMNKVIKQQNEKAEAAAREEQRKHYAEIRKTVKLDDNERSQVDQRAKERAQADYMAGKISSAEIAGKAESYVAELEKAMLDSKATNISFNEQIRQTWHGGLVNDGGTGEDE